jgi:ABC-2 type transport system ATP-binding protein
MTMSDQLERPAADAQGDAPAIVARALTKRYGPVDAVRDLSFEIAFGRVTGFLGPNGAGKSTTLRMVLGLINPTSGEATVLGVPYRALDHPTRSVGALLEAGSAHPLRSGRNHLRVLAAAAGLPESRVDEVLELVGLPDAADRRAGGYSLGMQQRLGLAGALLGDPRILVLDEPANGLDPAGMRWLRELLRGFAARGGAVFVSSHLLGEMSQVADEVIVIDRGRLVRRGSLRELTDGALAVRVRAAAADAVRLEAALDAEGLSVRPAGGELLMVTGASSETVGAIAHRAGVALTELRIHQETLEDAFLEMTTHRGGTPWEI